MILLLSISTRTMLDKIEHVFSGDVHDSGCVCPEHNVDIVIYYNEIVHASKIYVDLHVPAELRSALIRYWSVQLDDLKEQSKIFYDLWLFDGKPRSGDIY